MISLDRRVYKIEFINTNSVYLTDDLNEFMHLLKAENLIVDKITATVNRSGKFYRLSKKDLNSFTSWNTELNIELQKES